MPTDDPFAGLKLSDQATQSAPAAKLDQRLFSAEPTHPPKTPSEEQDSPQKPQMAAELTTAAPKPRAAEKVVLKPPSLSRTAFDLEDQPLYKSSFLFTQEEQEALEDLKLELSREHGDKVFKNDLIRAAIHMLVEDYRAHAQDSFVMRKIHRRK